jgi:hypothetical protein
VTVSVCTDPKTCRTIGLKSLSPCFPFLIEFVFVRTQKASNGRDYKLLISLTFIFSGVLYVTFKYSTCFTVTQFVVIPISTGAGYSLLMIEFNGLTAVTMKHNS